LAATASTNPTFSIVRHFSFQGILPYRLTALNVSPNPPVSSVT